MMGTPAGARGVRIKAQAIADAETINWTLFLSLGQTNPQNAAGTAASNPQTDGLPIALAPNAPILKVTGLKRVLSAQITIDESTAVATLQNRCDDLNSSRS